MNTNKENEPKSEIYTLLSDELFTGYYDDNNNPVLVGDTLKSEWGYEVIVEKDEDGYYTGKLVCEENHSCNNIPYALNSGKGHTKVFV